MTGSIFFAAFALFLQYEVTTAQEPQVPSSLTAAELWNPTTWFYPFAIATSEGYRDYYIKAQKATNELYKQIYATNAFPWITGNWGPAPGNKPSQSNQGGSGSQGGSTTPSGQNQTPAPSKQEEQSGSTEAPKAEEKPADDEQGNTEKPTESGPGAQVEGQVNDDGVQGQADVDDQQVGAEV